MEDVLGAVKRAVDDDPRPGRFLLTGSAGADLTAAGRPATGRVIRVPLWGFSERELVRNVDAPPFLSRLFRDGSEAAAVPPPPVQLPVRLVKRPRASLGPASAAAEALAKSSSMRITSWPARSSSDAAIAAR